VHERTQELLAAEGATIDDWRYCFHHPQGTVPDLTGDCECRKPKPGMLLDAATRHGLDLGASWMVGDSDTDVQAGQAAGCRTALIEHPGSAHRRTGAVQPDMQAATLDQFALHNARNVLYIRSTSRATHKEGG
jgi:D-glycero-D-manno-heptose 1,7-bisphosphate phosphatase